MKTKTTFVTSTHTHGSLDVCMVWFGAVQDEDEEDFDDEDDGDDSGLQASTHTYFPD